MLKNLVPKIMSDCNISDLSQPKSTSAVVKHKLVTK